MVRRRLRLFVAINLLEEGKIAISRSTASGHPNGLELVCQVFNGLNRII